MLNKILVAFCVVVLLSFSGLALAKTQTLRFTSPYSGGPWQNYGVKNFARLVNELTNGRVKLEVYPGGTLGSPLKVTELVQHGVVGGGLNWPAYDWGKDKTTVLFAGWVGGFNPEETLLWLFQGGGSDLLTKYRREKYDVESFPCADLTTEIGLMSNKKVNSLQDFRNLKIRTSGAWAKIASDLGASTVILPGSEVYDALSRHVVDAIEWGDPAINLPEGFRKIAKYIVVPGIHQPGGIHECMFNAKVWKKIDKHDQDMMILAGKINTYETWAKYSKDDLDAWKVYKNSKTNVITRWDKSFMKAAAKAANDWAEQQKKGNTWFQKVYASQNKFKQKLKLWPDFTLPTGNWSGITEAPQ